MTVPSLKSFSRIQKNSHGPLVHQLHFHPFLKAPGLAAQSGGANLFHKEVVELACFFRGRRRVERRPLAPSHVPVQRELRNRQHASANVLHAPRSEEHTSEL